MMGLLSQMSPGREHGVNLLSAYSELGAFHGYSVVFHNHPGSRCYDLLSKIESLHFYSIRESADHLLPLVLGKSSSTVPHLREVSFNDTISSQLHISPQTLKLLFP